MLRGKKLTVNAITYISDLLFVAFIGFGLKMKKPYISLIYKVFYSVLPLISKASRVEDGARTHDLRNHNPTL